MKDLDARLQKVPAMCPTASCPGCGNTGIAVIYEAAGIPVHSVLLLSSPQEARAYPRGDLVLGYCSRCGLISNYAYNAALQEYSTRCEETQGCSETFRQFQAGLARRLIERYGLRGKRILEIGCGKGEFLSLLCGLGGNTGVGFDPAFVPGRLPAPAEGQITFVQDFYSEKYAGFEADFICCQMTLEHISDVGHFLSVMRMAARNPDTTIFIQVPEASRILSECAFEDIYYEHCTYFTQVSLANLLTAAGFHVLASAVEFQGQYITIEAGPAGGASAAGLIEPHETSRLIVDFRSRMAARMGRWRHFLRGARAGRRRAALWGSGSKSVAFLTGLSITDEVHCVVDINPNRQGTYVAGTGHEIVKPEKLIDVRPDVVVVMNAAYDLEVRRFLANLGIKPRTVHL